MVLHTRAGREAGKLCRASRHRERTFSFERDTTVKITRVVVRRVAVSPRGGWLFVQAHTDEGLIGLGEASQGGEDARVASSSSSAWPRRWPVAIPWPLG